MSCNLSVALLKCGKRVLNQVKKHEKKNSVLTESGRRLLIVTCSQFI